MTQKTVVSLIDDLTGGPKPKRPGVRARRVSSVIDLAKDNAEALREVLAPYIAAARRTGGRARYGTGSRVHSLASSGVVANAAGRSREAMKAIRDRAKSSGWAVSDRGRPTTRGCGIARDGERR